MAHNTIMHICIYQYLYVHHGQTQTLGNKSTNKEVCFRAWSYQELTVYVEIFTYI